MSTNGNEAREDARNKLLAAILERASLDADFRSRLLSDPKETVKDCFGIAIPDHIRIRFIEKDPTVDVLVVLPNLVDPSAALGASDLEVVSGGQDDGGGEGADAAGGGYSPW